MKFVPPYRLSATLAPAHQGDVKNAIAVSQDRVVTCSRDTSVGIWDRFEGTRQFSLQRLLGGHKAYVNSLAFIPSEGSKDGDLIASGSNSAVILLHPVHSETPEPLHTLPGHGLNVCTLAYSTKLKKLISGSWDCTARVWSRDEKDEWRCIARLDAHQEAVWGVGIIDEGPHEGCFLTGGADRKIKLWSSTGEELAQFKGSTEAVRSIQVLPGGEAFVSASNDGNVRIWSFNGDILDVLKAHTDYVYMVALVAGCGDIASCGEDHSVRIWRECQQVQTLLHPCQTVWSVSSLPNGDLITGGSDGYARVWTRDASRVAEEDVLMAYEKEVEDGMQKSDPIAAERGETSKMSTEYTISIDISDDSEPLSLVFSEGTDPREAASAFGKKHDLSQNYINRIEEFVRLHIAQGNLPLATPSTSELGLDDEKDVMDGAAVQALDSGMTDLQIQQAKTPEDELSLSQATQFEQDEEEGAETPRPGATFGTTR